MLPSSDDPRWRRALLGAFSPPLKQLVTKILFTKARLVASDPARMTEAVAALHDYFARNEQSAAEDLRALLGGEP